MMWSKLNIDQTSNSDFGQGALHQEVAPVLLHALKLCAAAANKSVGYRRKLHVNAVKGQNGRDRLAKIQPGECSLFGKKVSTLIKSMSDNVKVFSIGTG